MATSCRGEHIHTVSNPQRLKVHLGYANWCIPGEGIVSESKHLCKASEGLSGVEVLEKPYHVDRNASKSLSLLLWSIALCAQSNPLFIQLAQLSLLLVVLPVPHDPIDISPHNRINTSSYDT